MGVFFWWLEVLPHRPFLKIIMKKIFFKLLFVAGVVALCLGIAYNIVASIQIWSEPITLALKFNTYWPGALLMVMGVILVLLSAFEEA